MIDLFIGCKVRVMPKRIKPKKAPDKRYRVTYLRAYREKAQLSLEKATERFIHFGLEDMSPASLSRIERGLQPYSQPILEVACNVYGTDEYSLLWRDPSNPDAIWSIWDQALPGERRIIVETGQSLIKNRAS